MKKKERWIVWGALAGLAAWLIWWKKPTGEIIVEVSVPPYIHEEGGPYGIRTIVTNPGTIARNVVATATCDVGGIVLAITPSSLSFTLAPGETKSDYFWFTIPAGTVGLIGHAAVNVDGVSDTTEFVVVSLY